jgi:hypothetical protein
MTYLELSPFPALILGIYLLLKKVEIPKKIIIYTYIILSIVYVDWMLASLIEFFDYPFWSYWVLQIFYAISIMIIIYSYYSMIRSFLSLGKQGKWVWDVPHSLDLLVANGSWSKLWIRLWRLSISPPALQELAAMVKIMVMDVQMSRKRMWIAVSFGFPFQSWEEYQKSWVRRRIPQNSARPARILLPEARRVWHSVQTHSVHNLLKSTRYLSLLKCYLV